MTRSITIALSLFFLTAIGAMAQCAYTITGQVTNANSQVVNNQPVLVTSSAGTDTVYTNPNGVYLFNLMGICDSSMTFTLQTMGCGAVTGATTTVPLNQTVNVPLTLCNTQASCTTSVQVSVTGNIVQFGWVGSSLGGATAQSVLWSFGDGNTSNNYPNGGSYTYTNPGTYQICAEVLWSDGCVSSDCENATIAVNALDSCQATVYTSVSGDTVQYWWAGSSLDSSAVQSVTWYTSNGIALGSSAIGGSFTFNPGTYTICANVVWTGGCSASGCSTFTIGGNQQQNICGCVNYVDANNDTVNAGCGTAYLLQLDSSTNIITILDSADVTPNGYCFYGNYSGDYTVWVQPCANVAISQNLLPTYLGNTLFWQNASNATLNNFGANCIMLVSGQSAQGPAQINGTILWGDDKAPGDPVVGVNVLLLDDNSEPVAYTVTDAEGFYSFNNLPYGTYQIYPEAAGNTTYPIFVTVSSEAPTVEADNFYFGFGIFSASAGIEESVINMSGLYPNPAQEMAILSVTSKESGSGKLNITDVTGKTVSHSNVNVIKGQQNITLNLQNITAGVYTVTLTLNGQQLHAKFIKK